jgi:hypothetical protein
MITPLERYKKIIDARNWKVEQGISLYNWKDGRESKHRKKSKEYGKI